MTHSFYIISAKIGYISIAKYLLTLPVVTFTDEGAVDVGLAGGAVPTCTSVVVAGKIGNPPSSRNWK